MKARYILEEAWRSAVRNRGTYLLAAAVQAICLILFSIFLVLTFNVSTLVRAASKRIELYAFLSSDADANVLTALVTSIDGVTGARYVSKDEALEELRSDLGEDSSLTTALGENPLPASIRVTVHPSYAHSAQLDQVEKKLTLLPGVSEVWSGKDLIARLNRVARTVLLLDILILVIISMAVAFIVFQTVESSIVARGREIEIMELVGASGAAVRAPFIIEGTSQGLIGGAVAFGLVYVLYRFVVTAIPSPVFPLATVLAFDLVLGVVLGLAGSVIALNRIQNLQRQGLKVGTPDAGLR
jgi:cell division transport system permease protein